MAETISKQITSSFINQKFCGYVRKCLWKVRGRTGLQGGQSHYSNITDQPQSLARSCVCCKSCLQINKKLRSQSCSHIPTHFMRYLKIWFLSILIKRCFMERRQLKERPTFRELMLLQRDCFTASIKRRNKYSHPYLSLHSVHMACLYCIKID